MVYESPKVAYANPSGLIGPWLLAIREQSRRELLADRVDISIESDNGFRLIRVTAAIHLLPIAYRRAKGNIECG